MNSSAQTIEQEFGDATPERIAKSNDNAIIDGVRVFSDSLIVRMAAKGQLYPDADINRALLMAGEKYYGDWYGSNMSTLAAMDYGKVSGGGGGAGSHMPASHLQALARGEYRKARAFLGVKYRKALESILLDEQDLVAVGAKITGMASEKICRSVAIERFTAGLYLLAMHYGLI